MHMHASKYLQIEQLILYKRISRAQWRTICARCHEMFWAHVLARMDIKMKNPVENVMLSLAMSNGLEENA